MCSSSSLFVPVLPLSILCDFRSDSNQTVHELFLVTLIRFRQFEMLIIVQESCVLGVQYVSEPEVLDKRLLKRFGHQVELVSMPSLAADQAINRVFKGAELKE